MPKSTKKYIYALGRRKTSVATIKLFKGKSDSLVNHLPLDKYFTNPTHLQAVLSPLVLTRNLDKFYFEATVTGGGKTGQSNALMLSLSRALNKLDPNHHGELKKASLLTVDSRVRQRRMIDTGGKARRKKQSPKR